MNIYSIGIDIGGTNTDIGLVRFDGLCLAKRNLPTNKYFDASIYVSDICEAIKALMAENDIEAIDGIGIAAPAGNYYTGCIENATNLNFKGIIDLPKLFHEKREDGDKARFTVRPKDMFKKEKPFEKVEQKEETATES